MKHTLIFLSLTTLASNAVAVAQFMDLSDQSLSRLDYSDTHFATNLSLDPVQAGYRAAPSAITNGNNNPLEDTDSVVQSAIANRFAYRFKTESLGLWSDGEIVATASADYGVATSALRDWSKSVDLNRWSGIDTEGSTRLNKLLYQHQFQQLRTDLAVGLQSFNDTFYQLDTTNLFAMPALNRGPELQLPSATSFANSAVGVKLKYRFDDYYVQAASYDSSSGHQPDKLAFNTDQGLFTAVESGIKTSGKFKLAAGAWNHVSAQQARANLPQDEQYGYYVIAETQYSPRTSLFMQLGQSNSGLNQISDFRSAGAVIKDIFADQDSLGVAFAKVAKDDHETASATAWELTYRTPTLLTTDIQTSLFFQHNPSLELDQQTDRVMGMRFHRVLF